MILTDSEVGSVKAALHCWELLGYASTAIVFAGCVGEYIAEFTSLPGSERAVKKLARLSLSVLILGISGELLTAVRASQLSGLLIANIEQNAEEANERASANEKEAAQARRDAETAKQQSADSVERAGKAEQRAAEANRTAEQERLARVEIEEALATRRLRPKENALLHEWLSQFAGEGAGIVYLGGDAEGFTFAWDIAKALHDANWAVPTPGGIIEMQEVGLPFDDAFAKLRSGVEVVDMGTPQSQRVALALADALNACGFDAAAVSRPGKNVSTGVQIMVETRPLGPQGEAKLRALARKKTNR